MNSIFVAVIFMHRNLFIKCTYAIKQEQACIYAAIPRVTIIVTLSDPPIALRPFQAWLAACKLSYIHLTTNHTSIDYGRCQWSLESCHGQSAPYIWIKMHYSYLKVGSIVYDTWKYLNIAHLSFIYKYSALISSWHNYGWYRVVS